MARANVTTASAEVMTQIHPKFMTLHEQDKWALSLRTLRRTWAAVACRSGSPLTPAKEQQLKVGKHRDIFHTRSLQNYRSSHSFLHILKLSEMYNQRGDTKFASSVMCSVRAGASCKAQQKDLMITGKWVVIKGNSDLISTNSSQCARRITLPVCTIELSVRSLKSCLKYHLRGKKEGRKKKQKKTSQGNTVLRINELPQAKQNHDKSLNPGHTHSLKTVGCIDIERVKQN